jgi:hypothetical protein
MTIDEAESLLKTRYKIFEHKKAAKRSLACDEHNVPADVQRHIDYITPTLNSALIIKRASSRGELAASTPDPTLIQDYTILMLCLPPSQRI